MGGKRKKGPWICFSATLRGPRSPPPALYPPPSGAGLGRGRVAWGGERCGSAWDARTGCGRVALGVKQSAGAVPGYSMLNVLLIQAASEFCRIVQNMLVVCESCVGSCLVAVA